MLSIAEINLQNIAESFNKEDLAQATIAQTIKDFESLGITLSIKVDDPSYGNVFAELCFQLKKLIEFDFPRLMSVLYRIDISEKEIANAENQYPELHFAELLASLILLRELKKVLYRKHYSNQQ